MRQYIDLHTHSTASDGTFSPEELLALAAKSGITTLALTDHDSIAGLDAAQAQAQLLGLEFIRGCELSCSTEYGHVDILGLWLPRNIPEFEQHIAWLREYRNSRNLQISERLADLGMNIDLAQFAQNLNSIGRPHIARLLMQKGYVSSIREAFDRFLGKGKPAYIPKQDYPPVKAVELLAKTRAIVVLAHPMLIRAPKEILPSWLDRLIQELIPYGLDGLEAYHSEHSNADIRQVLALADKYKLLVSGGSDFHGANKPGVSLGKGHGNLCVPTSVLDRLKIRLHEKQGTT